MGKPFWPRLIESVEIVFRVSCRGINMAKLYRGLALNDIAILIVFDMAPKLIPRTSTYHKWTLTKWFSIVLCPCSSSHSVVSAKYLQISHSDILGLRHNRWESILVQIDSIYLGRIELFVQRLIARRGKIIIHCVRSKRIYVGNNTLRFYLNKTYFKSKIWQSLTKLTETQDKNSAKWSRNSYKML